METCTWLYWLSWVYQSFIAMLWIWALKVISKNLCHMNLKSWGNPKINIADPKLLHLNLRGSLKKEGNINNKMLLTWVILDTESPDFRQSTADLRRYAYLCQSSPIRYKSIWQKNWYGFLVPNNEILNCHILHLGANWKKNKYNFIINFSVLLQYSGAQFFFIIVKMIQILWQLCIWFRKKKIRKQRGKPMSKLAYSVVTHQ